MDSIINYDSSSDNEDSDTNNTKRKAVETIDKQNVKMPKLPLFFESSKEPNKRDHQGRIRTVPHQEDSWATYVYCKVDLTDELKHLSTYTKNVNVLEEYHISLSRPIYLRKFQLDTFVARIKDQIKDIRPFDISFAQLATLTNDTNTRSFLTLEIGKGYNQLLECMKCVDETMIRFHKPKFYDPPRFHTSIAWSLNRKQIEDIHIPETQIENITKNTFFISKLYVKMGNRVEQVLFR